MDHQVQSRFFAISLGPRPPRFNSISFHDGRVALVMADAEPDGALDAFYLELKQAEEEVAAEADGEQRETGDDDGNDGHALPVIPATATIARSAALKTPGDNECEPTAREDLPPLPPPPVPPPVPRPPPGPPGPPAGPAAAPPQTGVVRRAAGKTWVDTQLLEWPENDFRIFVGNLGIEVNDSMLSAAFKRYASFEMAKVMKAKDGKTRGYGFVSLGSAEDGVIALREMQGQYIGSRPVLVKKATVTARTVKDKRGRAVTKTVNVNNNKKARPNHLGGH